MCDLCKDIGTDEKSILTHEMEIGNGNVKNIRILALYKEKLKVQTSIAEEMEKMAGTYHISYAEAVKDLYEKNKAIRHQKYKRCLAMAEWCNAEIGIADTDGDYEDMQWYQKWYENWLKLAKKFKEAKLPNVITA